MKDKKTETKQRILKPSKRLKTKKGISTLEQNKKSLTELKNRLQKKVKRMDTPRTSLNLSSFVEYSSLFLCLCRLFEIVGFMQMRVFVAIALDSLGNGKGLTTTCIASMVDRNNFRHVQIIVLEFYKLGLLERRKNSRQFYVYYLSVYSVERMQELLNEV